MDYREYQDNELLDYIYEGNEEAKELLFKKYEPLISSTARRFSNAASSSGLELNDLIQEGMLGFHIAINGYSDQHDTMFFTFAKTCVERKILSLLVASKRQKHRILNESLSIDAKEEGCSLEFLLGDTRSNPEEQVISRESEVELISSLRKVLTEFEEQVFDLKRNDFEYKEIADILDKDPKSVDNAIQRIKTKAKEILKETKEE